MSAAGAKLDGITVLDLSSVGPASRASRILADYGATIIKIAPVARKGSVQIRPPYYSYGAGRGMKRFCVDMKAPAGRDAFLRLAAGADVIIESFRPGVVKRLGIGYEDIAPTNKGLVYCSTSGYGQDGPYSQRAGHDLNYLATGGFLHCSGRRDDGGPTIPGATVADSAAGGMQAVIAILAALVARDKSGLGSYLDVSVADGVLQLMSLHVDRYLATGEEPGPGGDVLTGRYAYYDVYRTRDGKWLSVGAIEPAFYRNLCNALGLERLIEFQNDDARQGEIRAAFTEAFAERDRDDWMRELGDADACVASVYTIPELCADEQFQERKAFARAERGDGGEFSQVGAVLAGGDREPPLHKVADPASTDSADLLRAAGMNDREIEELRTAGVVE